MSSFEWDVRKEKQNQEKHGVSFYVAQFAFDDPQRVIIRDLDHEQGEKRFFCLGEGRKRYEEENKIY